MTTNYETLIQRAGIIKMEMTDTVNIANKLKRKNCARIPFRKRMMNSSIKEVEKQLNKIKDELIKGDTDFDLCESMRDVCDKIKDIQNTLLEIAVKMKPRIPKQGVVHAKGELDNIISDLSLAVELYEED